MLAGSEQSKTVSLAQLPPSWPLLVRPSHQEPVARQMQGDLPLRGRREELVRARREAARRRRVVGEVYMVMNSNRLL